MRHWIGWLLALGVSASALAAGGPDTLAHGRFTQVTVYRPAHEVKQFVLLLAGSADDGTHLTDAALTLAHEGA